MSSLRRLSSGRFPCALLVVALAMRALVPVGYMTSQAADGGLTVILCTATGLQRVILPSDEHGPSAPRAHGDSTCLFSLASGAALPPPLLWAAAEAPTTLVSFLPVAAALVNLPAIVRAQSSRGPPARLPA
jgi:hypothetical protein